MTHTTSRRPIFFSSLLLGLCYAIAVLYMTKGEKIYKALIFAIFLGCFANTRYDLFISYPLILSVVAIQFVQYREHAKIRLNTLGLLTFIVLSLPLGLLPLIKGSLLVSCAATMLAISFYFYYHHFRSLALIVLISPVTSAIIFWLVSGQSIIDLPSYFLNMAEVMSGYTEAMSTWGKFAIVTIMAYLLATFALAWSLLKTENITVSTKIFFGISLFIYCFIEFKTNFIHQGGYNFGSFASVALASLIIGNICSHKSIMVVFVGSVIVLFVGHIVEDEEISRDVQNKFGAFAYSKGEKSREAFFYAAELAIKKFPSPNIYGDSWNGLRSRILGNNIFQNKFDISLADIRKECAIPALKGTTDIYSYDQSCLLASNNKWNPRPIFQSFAAYTPKLAQLNEQHLRNNGAPDNVLFRLQTIFDRLPSLDDGLSWPALFDNYTVTNLVDGLAYFRKNETIQTSSNFDVIAEGIHKVGEEVSFPQTVVPIYAEIDIKSTLLGKFVSLVFKPPHLKIKLNLKNGVSEEYRVISGMMRTGFFISPLVRSTEEFLLLASRNQDYLKNNMVKSFNITVTPSFFGDGLWGDTYTLKLKSYKGEMVSTLPVKLPSAQPRPYY